MLSLNPGCICDVCAEEYGPRNLPHSISCGQWTNAKTLSLLSLTSHFSVQVMYCV